MFLYEVMTKEKFLFEQAKENEDKNTDFKTNIDKRLTYDIDDDELEKDGNKKRNLKIEVSNIHQEKHLKDPSLTSKN